MKRFLSILALSFFVCSTTIATEQITDVLIIGTDTVYLKSFPLEDLIAKNKINRPFDYGLINTGCWRGYIATWQIIDGYLALTKAESIDYSGRQLNIVEYLKNNGYNPKTINGYVIADWYTDVLQHYEYIFNMEVWFHRFMIISRDKDFSRRNKKVELEFENGKLIKNNILPIEAYKIGDKLWLSYRKIGVEDAQIRGVIKENNGKMVRLEIFSYGTDNEEVIEKIRETIINEGKNLYNFWVNPRYCERIE